ncbi:hypothetical protein GCM10027062_24680 [Nocardioides hungaricus]
MLSGCRLPRTKFMRSSRLASAWSGVRCSRNAASRRGGLSDAVSEAVLGNQTSHHKMTGYFFTDEVKVQLVKLLAELVHET